jgi:hypothetical protein
MGDEHLVMYHSGNFHVANMANLWLIYDIYIYNYIYMQRRWFFIAVLNNHRGVILVMLCGGDPKMGIPQ